MAVVIGLVVGLFALLGFTLIGKGIRNPRWALVVILLLAAAYYWGEERHQRDTEHLTISTTGTTGCGVNQVGVTLANAGPRDVRSFRFYLEGFKPNHSDSVAREGFRSDRIVRPGEAFTHCWDVEDLERVNPAEQPNLRWEIEISDVTLTE